MGELGKGCWKGGGGGLAWPLWWGVEERRIAFQHADHPLPCVCIWVHVCVLLSEMGGFSSARGSGSGAGSGMLLGPAMPTPPRSAAL
jgi:hypothetical protein